MKQRTGIRYLFCRGGRYTVRVQVPKDCQSLLNRTEYKKSLGEDFTKAKRDCHAVIGNFLSRIEAARNSVTRLHEFKPQSRIGMLEILDAVRAHYERMVGRISAAGSVDRRTKIANLTEVIEAQLTINAHEAWSALSNDARWLCEEQNWQLDDDSKEFEFLCEAMLRARLQAYRDEIRRLDGKRSTDPDADPLFDNADAKLSVEIKLGNLIDRFNAEREIYWDQSTRTNYHIITRVLEEVCGRDTPISFVNRDFCRNVRDILITMPANYKKMPQTRDKSINEAIEIAARIGLPKMKPATINSHLAKLGAIIRFGRDEGLIAGNPMANMDVPDPIRPEEKRDPFGIEQLKIIFSSEPWSQGEYAASLSPSRYWGPLIALFSGGRLTEIFGQRVDEMVEVDGVLGFQFIHRPDDRRVKGRKSRFVPVHLQLLQLGFLTFVEEARKSGRERLFPDAKQDSRGKWGDSTSDWFSRKIKKLCLKGRNLSFHSFRHCFEDALREADLHDTPLGNALTGRSTAGVSKNYGSKFSTAKLNAALNKISYPNLDLRHLEPTSVKS